MKITKVGAMADSDGGLGLFLHAMMEPDDDPMLCADILLMQARNRVAITTDSTSHQVHVITPQPLLEEPLPEFR